MFSLLNRSAAPADLLSSKLYDSGNFYPTFYTNNSSFLIPCKRFLSI